MQRITLTALFFLLIFTCCKKDSDDDTPGSDVPYKLMSFRMVGKEGDFTYQFIYDNSFISEVRMLVNGNVAGSAVIGWNLQPLTMSLWKGEPSTVDPPFQTLEYSYDFSARHMESEQLFEGNNVCVGCAHMYEYDDERRLKKHTVPNLFIRRFEYDNEGGNATKAYVKPWDQNTEHLEFEFLEYDKKNAFYGVDSNMRIILRSIFRSKVFWPDPVWSTTFERPMFAMINNVKKLRWHPRPHPQLVSLKRELSTKMEYNADGYPTKATLTYSKQFEGSSPEVWTAFFTYEKVE